MHHGCMEPNELSGMEEEPTKGMKLIEEYYEDLKKRREYKEMRKWRGWKERGGNIVKEEMERIDAIERVKGLLGMDGMEHCGGINV